MNNQQPNLQQFRYPPNQGSPFPHFANTPPRQFKSPLPLPPYQPQQNSQVQWSPHFSQQGVQPQPPLPQLLAHPQSPSLLPSQRSKRKLWLILGIVTLVVLFASIGVRPLASEGNTTSQPATTSQAEQSSQSQQPQREATQPAPKPTAIPPKAQAANWTTTHTFTGSEEKKTNTFYVGNNWKIIWTCNPGTIFGGVGIIVVNVFSSDGTFQRGAINDTCQAGHTTGSTIEQQGGNIYLDITVGGNWTIQIQELK